MRELKQQAKRQPTVSMTQLCKEIALEVFIENVDDIANKISDRYFDKRLDLKAAYQRWDDSEDKELTNDLSYAIRMISIRHKRSYDSILSRIKRVVGEL